MAQGRPAGQMACQQLAPGRRSDQLPAYERP